MLTDSLPRTAPRPSLRIVCDGDHRAPYDHERDLRRALQTHHTPRHRREV